MATVRDVARHAGVSVGTASKVLANNLTVKAHLRERVEQAVRTLGYKPNL
ncbi:MAG: LacI family DNA-binding transcriptional regulator, partial [Devosiaceae bacterium]|nr:LacI family DNA-binding transcriptional regulator [Devosiaceae bacterium MH13]